LEEQTRNVKIMMGILVIVIAFGALYSVGTHGMNEFFLINFGELSLALATIVLAIFTYQLASYTYILARTEIDENRKERRKLRIQEQLKELYSPLRAKMEYIFSERRDYITYFKNIIDEHGVVNKYEYYSNDKLKELMREYFTNILDLDSSFLRKMRLKEGSDMTDTYIIEKITEIKDNIISDYESLIEEYNELTKK
jgi:hypothetical protein